MMRGCMAILVAGCAAASFSLASHGAEPAAAPPPPGAEKCQLLQVATLDLGSETDGEVTIPVAINGQAGRWLIDTGNVRSMISDAWAEHMGIQARPSFTPMEMFGGTPILTEARVDELKIAAMSTHNYSLMVAPSRFLPADTIGMLAPDVMSSYDVEFDFAAGQFKMFSQDHCDGKVVYWTHGTYARVPFDLSSDTHIVVQVTIDGKEVDAVIDTGSPKSTMSLSAARSLFGLSATSPKMVTTARTSINGLPPTGTYSYPFETLTLEGVSVLTPQITIVDDSGLPGSTPRLLLGVQTLRQLHLYVAYGEHALYVTPAEAR